MATKDEVYGRLRTSGSKTKKNTHTLIVAIDKDSTLLVLFDDRTVNESMRKLMDTADDETYTEDADGNPSNPSFPPDLYAAIWSVHFAEGVITTDRFQDVRRRSFLVEDVFGHDLQLHRFKLSHTYYVYDYT